MPAPTLVAESWLFATLDGGLAVPVSSHPAPEGTDPPLVTFALLSAVDVRGNDANVLITTCRYLIRAVARGRSFPYVLADAADQLVHRQSGTAAGGQVLRCVRDAPYTLGESVDGVEYRHAGAEYVLTVSTT